MLYKRQGGPGQKQAHQRWREAAGQGNDREIEDSDLGEERVNRDQSVPCKALQPGVRVYSTSFLAVPSGISQPFLFRHPASSFNGPRNFSHTWESFDSCLNVSNFFLFLPGYLQCRMEVTYTSHFSRNCYHLADLISQSTTMRQSAYLLQLPILLNWCVSLSSRLYPKDSFTGILYFYKICSLLPATMLALPVCPPVMQVQLKCHPFDSQRDITTFFCHLHSIAHMLEHDAATMLPAGLNTELLVVRTIVYAVLQSSAPQSVLLVFVGL